MKDKISPFGYLIPLTTRCANSHGVGAIPANTDGSCATYMLHNVAGLCVYTTAPGAAEPASDGTCDAASSLNYQARH